MEMDSAADAVCRFIGLLPPARAGTPPLITASVIKTAILSDASPAGGGDSTPRGGANPSALPPAEETPPPPEGESNLFRGACC